MSCYSTKAKPKREYQLNLPKKHVLNPKYEHVKAMVNTGKSLTKYQEVMEQMRRNYKQRKDEIFKRINVTTFVQLILQVYRMNNIPIASDNESDSSGDGAPAAGETVDNNDNANNRPRPPASARSTLTSVIHGVGEMDVNDEENERKDESMIPFDSEQVECPYLLLDIRDTDEYKQCHIVTAKSYPTSMLSRYNGETNEIRQYKNRAGRIIVIYDYNEKAAALQAAHTLVQRGYENLFFLSGGLQLAGDLFPHGLSTGALPAEFGKRALSAAAGGGKLRRAAPRVPALSAASAATSHEHRDTFTNHDLEVLEQTLMELTLPAGGGSAGGGSRARSAASTRSWTGTGTGAPSDPGRPARPTRPASSYVSQHKPWK